MSLKTQIQSYLVEHHPVDIKRVILIPAVKQLIDDYEDAEFNFKDEDKEAAAKDVKKWKQIYKLIKEA